MRKCKLKQSMQLIYKLNNEYTAYLVHLGKKTKVGTQDLWSERI